MAERFSINPKCLYEIYLGDQRVCVVEGVFGGGGSGAEIAARLVNGANAYGRQRDTIRELTASLSRTRAKLRDLIRDHPDPGADALAVEWEAGDVLARAASEGGENG